jgi:hypothetical protein
MGLIEPTTFPAQARATNSHTVKRCMMGLIARAAFPAPGLRHWIRRERPTPKIGGGRRPPVGEIGHRGSTSCPANGGQLLVNRPSADSRQRGSSHAAALGRSPLILPTGQLGRGRGVRLSTAAKHYYFITGLQVNVHLFWSERSRRTARGGASLSSYPLPNAKSSRHHDTRLD